MCALGMESVLVGLVIDRILLAIVARVGVGAAHAEGTVRPAALEFARLIAMDAVARIKAAKIGSWFLFCFVFRIIKKNSSIIFLFWLS